MEQLIPLLYLDVPTEPSGVIYPVGAVNDACKEFEELIEEHGGVPGEYGRPPIDTSNAPTNRYQAIDLTNVSHIVKHVWTENGVLMCKVHLLRHYAEMAEHLGFEYRGIPRAVGVTDEKLGMCTKYTLITVDIALTDTIYATH